MLAAVCSARLSSHAPHPNNTPTVHGSPPCAILFLSPCLPPQSQAHRSQPSPLPVSVASRPCHAPTGIPTGAPSIVVPDPHVLAGEAASAAMEGRGAGQMSPRQATQQAGDGGDGWDLRALPRLAADASPAGRRAVAPCGKRGGVSESREGAVAFRVAREAMREMALLRQSVKDLFQVRTEAHKLVCCIRCWRSCFICYLRR